MGTRASLSCTNLLSLEFVQAIEKAFKSEYKRKHVVNITRAYYVFIDLKSGITLDKIEKYRLEPFHSFLWNFISLNEKDKLSCQLWEICDDILSKINI